MWNLTLGIIILSVVASAKEEKKAVAEKRTPEKRGATSFTHIVRGGAPGHSSLVGPGHGAAAAVAPPFHGLQIAYLPLAAAYGHGYAAPGYTQGAYSKDIPLAVHHQPYPAAYPIKIAYALPVDRPYPFHIIKPYTIAAVDKVPVSQPVSYAAPAPIVPYPAYVKAPQHQGYDSNYASPAEYSSRPQDTFRGGYSSYSDSGPPQSYNNGDGYNGHDH